MKRKLVVIFTHTNYCLHSSGTEKFIREYSSVLHENGYDSLSFFPIDPRKDLLPKYTGVIYNEQFCGIFKYSHICEIINHVLAGSNANLYSICILHLKNQNLEYLSMLINNLGVPVNIFIHDYFSLCLNYRMIDTNGKPCGVSRPTVEKCRNCAIKEKGYDHFRQISGFYKSIFRTINKVIVPSDYVKETIEKELPFIKEKIYVRPHLLLKGSYRREEIKDTDRVKIAYVGAQIDDKGYFEWKLFVTQMMNKNNYDFYYFGFGEDKVDGVNSVYVAGSKSDKTMDDYLKEYGIDCALVWSKCPETYSYVYYELSVAGVYIITNCNSGNIADQIYRNKNGLVLQTIDDFIGLAKNNEELKRKINDYRTNCTYTPSGYIINKDLCLDNVTNSEYYRCIANKPKHIRKLHFLTLLYVLKHKIAHKGEKELICSRAKEILE